MWTWLDMIYKNNYISNHHTWKRASLGHKISAFQIFYEPLHIAGCWKLENAIKSFDKMDCCEAFKMFSQEKTFISEFLKFLRKNAAEFGIHLNTIIYFLLSKSVRSFRQVGT